jgi:hypothetical protein
MIPDLSDRAIAAALFGVLDEIADAAVKTSRHDRTSARLLGRVLAFRLGLRVIEGQRVAKAWQSSRATARLVRDGAWRKPSGKCADACEMRKAVPFRGLPRTTRTEITVIREDGEEDIVVREETVWRSTAYAMSGKSTEKRGAPRCSLLDGTPVEQVDRQTFRISGTEFLLRRKKID